MTHSSLLSHQTVTIAVIAPSGSPIDDLAVERGLQTLVQRGFQVTSYYQPEQRYQRFAAHDSERIEQMNAAAENPDVDVVMALRGSYGLSRLLPHLDFDYLANCGKLFVGYSDFTPLHMGLLAKNRISLAGPMLCDDFTRENPSDYTLDQFASCLARTNHIVEFKNSQQTDLVVQGLLWGGNLAMLTHLLGTPYWTDVDDGILFLEDIGEHPYRIERMLLQLHFAGVLSKQKAIVLGDFSAYRLVPNDNGYDVDAMLNYIRSIVPVPIVTGLPFGHVRDRATLVVGSQASLESNAGNIRLTMEYVL